MRDELMVKLRGVSKTYRRGAEAVAVLHGLDFSVAAGAFDAVMGPSGSGKTTVLNLLSGIDRPSHGTVEVMGSEISTWSDNQLADWRAGNVGLVFQFYNLIQVMTAYENVELPLLLKGMSSRERQKRVRTALDLVGLSERQSHLPRELSGGQEQRVGIARAIVMDPSLIVADEPTGDLDRETAEEIVQLFNVLNKDLKKTIVIVTHDHDVARAAQTIHRLDKGKLLPSIGEDSR